MTLCCALAEPHMRTGDHETSELLTEPEFKRHAVVIQSLKHSTRNCPAVALSFYAGLRACEMAGLRVGDVFDAQGKPKGTIDLSAV